MLKGARGRRGFTLIETVVTVGIVATLAAVVVPQVVKQFDSADPTKAAEDLNAIASGISTFSLNVRPHQPAQVEDLTNPLVATDLNQSGTAFTVADSSAWLGPYLSTSVPTAADGNDVIITTGYDATILNGLPLFDVDDTEPVGGDSITSRSTALQFAAADFVAVVVTNISGAAFTAINDLIDGPGENTVELRRNSGRFRCPYPSASVPTTDGATCAAAYYLAAPLRK